MDAVRADIETAVRAKYARRLEQEIWGAEWDLRHAYDIAIEEETWEAIEAAVEAIEAAVEAIEDDARARKEPHLVDEIEQAVSAVRAKFEQLIQQETEQRLAQRARRRR